MPNSFCIRVRNLLMYFAKTLDQNLPIIVFTNATA